MGFETDDTVMGESRDASVPPARKMAAIIPVGPDPLDLWRATQLIESLMTWEPDLGWCVTIDDSLTPRGLADLRAYSSSCRAVSLTNPRGGRGHGAFGGLCEGVLFGLAWLQSQTDADVVIKLDTDSLAIGPFAAAIDLAVRQRPGAGLIGVLGGSCNPHVRALHKPFQAPSILRAYHAVGNWMTTGKQPDLSISSSIPRILSNPAALRAFDSVRSHIASAVTHGYRFNDYCQGGAYALTRTMLDRMAAAGYLPLQNVWVNLPFGEDAMTAMYVKAIGLSIHDCVDRGAPFGVQFTGLPFPPEDLAAQGYGLIHSVKNDTRFGENEIRAYFRQRRSIVPDNVISR